jgi:hypothetical protein
MVGAFGVEIDRGLSDKCTLQDFGLRLLPAVRLYTGLALFYTFESRL